MHFVNHDYLGQSLRFVGKLQYKLDSVITNSDRSKGVGKCVLEFLDSMEVFDERLEEDARHTSESKVIDAFLMRKPARQIKICEAQHTSYCRSAVTLRGCLRG